MTRLLLFFSISASLFAQTTTVTEPVDGADLQGANGRGSIQISAPCRSGTTHVGLAPIPVTVSGGAFSVNLVPNDTCIPAGTSYTVTWQMSSATPGAAQQWQEIWVVPTSSTPVTVDSIIVQVAPSPNLLLPPTQIAAAGLGNGTYCLNVVAGVITGLVVCTGGGGGSSSWSLTTSSSWTSVTSTSWTGLTS
jgi:hypothetical protein